MMKLLWAVGGFFSGFIIGFIIIWLFKIDTSAEGSEIYAGLPTVLGVVFLVLLNLDLIGVRIRRDMN